jgi:hypothetical protein
MLSFVYQLYQSLIPNFGFGKYKEVGSVCKIGFIVAIELTKVDAKVAFLIFFSDESFFQQFTGVRHRRK